jgi:hypothetical protein
VITRFTHTLKRPFSIDVLARWRELDAAILVKLKHGTGLSLLADRRRL